MVQKIESRLTVFFENPFWIGIYEQIIDGNLSACKITFGTEPRDYEVYDFYLQNWNRLRFSPPVKADSRQDLRINPKRMQRTIKKQLETCGAGTKYRQALKLQQEERKILRKEKRYEQKEEEKQRRFDLRQQKRKEKHRGR